MALNNGNIQTAVDDYLGGGAPAAAVIAAHGDMPTWNVTGVTLMRNLFKNKTSIPDLSGWNTVNVVSMQKDV